MSLFNQSVSPVPRKQFRADIMEPGDGPNAVKYQKALKDEAEVREALSRMDSAIVKASMQPESVHPGDKCILVTEKPIEHSVMREQNLEVEVWKFSTTQCLKLAKANRLFWFCPTYEAECHMMLPAQDTPDEDVSEFFTASRVMGGYIVGQCWLQQCHERRQLLRPLMALQPAFTKDIEVLIHKSMLGQDKAEMTTALPVAKALATCHEAWKKVRGQELCFILRSDPKDMMLACRSLRCHHVAILLSQCH